MNPLYFAIFSMFLVGIADFTMKLGMNKGANGIALFLYSAIIMVIVVGLFAFSQKIPLKINSTLFIFSVINGILLSFGTISILIALKTADASIVFSIGRLGLIITVICAFIFLKEKITIEKITGIALALVSIYLLTKK